MTGSSDGVLKVFRNYESSKEVEIVTAFRALPELIPSNRNAGLVMDWQQGQGKALVAGDVKVIRVWNAATEVCTNVSHSTRVVDITDFVRTFLHGQAHVSLP
jgi:regulator-associated protein of mTOR